MLEGKVLLKWIESQGFGQDEFAKKINVSRQTIYNNVKLSEISKHLRFNIAVAGYSIPALKIKAGKTAPEEELESPTMNTEEFHLIMKKVLKLEERLNIIEKEIEELKEMNKSETA